MQALAKLTSACPPTRSLQTAVVRCSSRFLSSRQFSTGASVAANTIDAEEYAHYSSLDIQSPVANVLVVNMNRPKALNAFNEELWVDTKEVFQQAHDDPNVRAIVLGGNGKHFTSGLDLHDSGQKLLRLIEDDTLDVARRAFRMEQVIKQYQASFTAIEKCSVPVIAVIQGACVGAGVDLSSACDIRYCTEDAFFSIKEVDVGLAADVGTLQRLPKVMGNESLVRELAFTGRNLTSGEALSHGFVSSVCETVDEARGKAVETATIIASKSPVAVEGTKRNLLFSRDHSVDEGLAYIATWNAAMLQTEDLRKGIKAFVTKQAAPFDHVDCRIR